MSGGLGDPVGGSRSLLCRRDKEGVYADDSRDDDDDDDDEGGVVGER